MVAALLASEQDGALLSTEETAAVDLKEEAGRRNGPQLEPGLAQNPEAATKLADEVACLANSPGGGALILGVEDRTGQVLGTELDVDWLRQRINRAVSVAPDIVVQYVAGQRVLVLYVAESPEPIHDTGDRLRWRVGDECARIDRSEWWQHRERARETDPMAAPSGATPDDVTQGALRLVRSHTGADPMETDEDLLRRLGAVRSDNRLSQAGRLLFTPAARPLIELTVLDVHGGNVINRVVPDSSSSLLEQLDNVEKALETLNDFVVHTDSFAAESVRKVPPNAVREAVLNGLIHRDWNRSELTDVRWIEHDSTLVVRNPGGFTGGISADNVLSNRHARYPALADLFRAMGLVEKQGLGVDRMYQAMISLGHRPPIIAEEAGDRVTCTLVGGPPVRPVMELVGRIRPTARQKDYRIAIIVDALLHRPFLALRDVADALQSDAASADVALQAATQSTVDGEALIRTYKDVWVFGRSSWRLVAVRRASTSGPEVLPHASTDSHRLRAVVDAWLGAHPAITSGDLTELTGVARGTAQRALQDLEGTDLRKVGGGRSTRYEPVP